MGKVVSPNLSKVESASVHRRIRSTTAELSIASASYSDPIKVTLPANEVVLQRHLGVFSGVSLIVGVIIGAGIFISPKGVLQDTGSVGFCLIVWALCGVLALLGALCYAEIGTLIPRNGAEVAYLKEGIGSKHPLWGDISAYLFNWTNTFILKPASVAVLTLTFAEYFLAGLMDACGPPAELRRITAIFMILILVNINSLSVSGANRLNIIFVICKVSTVCTVIFVGFMRMMQGHTNNLRNGFAGTKTAPFAIALSFYNGLWAYDGWNSLNAVTEEIKNPKRNLWLSIALALPTITIFYVLINISYFTVLDKYELLSSEAVAVSWGEVAISQFVRALNILIAISALGSANGTLFAGSRNCMVGAQYGYLPDVFAFIHSKRLTPLPSIVLQGIVSIIWCLVTDIGDLITLFNFAAWIFYGLTFAATLVCKFTMKDVERVISVPKALIIFIILVSVYLVFAPIISEPKMGYFGAGAFILSGMVFYYPFVHLKKDLKIMKTTNAFLTTFLDLQRAQVSL